MADQGNQQFGGQGIPMPGGQNPQSGGQNPPAGGQPSMPVPPVPAPVPTPAAPTVPTVPTPGFPGTPAPTPVAPVAPAPVPTSGVPTPPSVPAPAPVAPAAPMPAQPAAPAAPAAPAKPKKPMTLEDLAKQTPIFSDAELEEDDFDPWAPLDDAKFDEPEDEAPEVVQEEPKKEEPKKEASPKEVPKEAVKPAVPAPDLTPQNEDPVEDHIDVIEGDVVEADIDDPFEGIEPDEDSPLKDFFANVNIDGRKIVGCFVAFLIIIAIIFGLIFGGRALFNFLSSDPGSSDQPVKEVVQEEPKKEEPKEVVKEEPKEEPKETPKENLEPTNTLPENWVDPTIYAGIKAGEDGALESLPTIPVSDTSTLTGGSENMVEYVSTLSQIRNLYETDIASLLNRSTDRNATLSEFIAQLKASQKAGVDAIPVIESRKFEIEEEFNRVTADKQAQEDAYFENLTANNAVEADANLQNFIVLARESVDLRARYRALDKVEELMIQYTSAMENRIRDVEFNREALIKGVRVIDVEGSNIDLIIPETNL